MRPGERSAWDYSRHIAGRAFSNIEPASAIIAAIGPRVGVLIWTAKKTCDLASSWASHTSTTMANSATHCTPWSPQSMSMLRRSRCGSRNRACSRSTALRSRPWPARCSRKVDEQHHYRRRTRIVVRRISAVRRFWWFFPTLNSPFNTRAIVYNYKESWWTQCRLSRSAGITSRHTAHPIFADGPVAFQHEVGSAYANASMPVVLPFAESFDLSLTGGAFC